jgi:hypothetical protein
MAGDPSEVAATIVTGPLALLVPPVTDVGCCEKGPLGFDEDGSLAGGVDASPSSSGMGAQYVFKTCFNAGRLIGLDKKKSIPESRHSFTLDSSAYYESG